MPMRKAGAILTGLAMLLLPAAAPPPIDDGDAIGSTAEHAAVLAATTAYFEARDKGDYARAYRQIGPSMTAYLTPALYEDAGRRFAAEAGAWQGRVVTRLTWTRDPPEAPRPGLYVAADFTARYVNLELMCGYDIDQRHSPNSARGSFLDRRRQPYFAMFDDDGHLPYCDVA
jgi:hypothetical protein